MSELVTFSLKDEKSMKKSAQSLVHSLYSHPITILFTGELGAGKTTFIQAFAEELGVSELVNSPTFALEQRYSISQYPNISISQLENNSLELVHIDLYRLDSNQAQEFIESSNDFEGIRCIEWAERLEHAPPGALIRVHIDEDETDRSARHLRIDFQDVDLPTREQIEQWRQEVFLPENVCRHCDAVGKVAERIGREMNERNIITRPQTLNTAGQLHDLLRFIDFKPEGLPNGTPPSKQQQECWDEWKEQYAGLGHEAACAAFLREQKYYALASIIEPHGLRGETKERHTIEQKILFYADKLLIIDKEVTLEERFADFRTRYTNGEETPQHREWYEEVKAVEVELRK